MKLAIMQPYFLPYVGYFQLMAVTGRFVVLDNVNFIKGGYIHRNQIWLGRHAGWFRLPVVHASANRKIDEHRLALSDRERARLLRMAHQGYAAAPCRDEGMSILERCLSVGRPGLVETLLVGLRLCAESLGLKVNFGLASDLAIDGSLRGQQRVLSICRQLRATSYVNLPGGRALYDAQAFDRQGCSLGFLEPGLLPYEQGHREFMPNLSILDLIMHVAPGDRRRHMQAATVDWVMSASRGIRQ
jgi:hypothetical protein